MKYVIAFDIVDDRKRYRVVKALLEYCYRVQKSVFEGFISKEGVRACREKIEKIIDPRVDSVRFYQMCSGCAGNIVESGCGPLVEEVKYTII